MGDLAGFRMVIGGQYDELFRGTDLVAAQRAADASRPYLDTVLRALDPPERGAHLDVGCGSGAFALHVARARPSLRVVGLDVSAQAVALAAAAAHAQGVRNAEFVHEEAESPPPGPFDTLSALSVFNLMPDKPEALHAWRRAAEGPGARLVLTDAFDLAGAGTLGAGAMREEGFAALAQRCGWRVVHRQDLTPMVQEMHSRGAWTWREYVRDGFAYLLFVLESA